MSTIADYFSLQDSIDDLKLRLDKSKKETMVQRSARYRAESVKDKALVLVQRSVHILIKLSLAGRINLTDKEIAESCFVCEKSVVEARSRLKNDKK